MSILTALENKTSQVFKGKYILDMIAEQELISALRKVQKAHGTGEVRMANFHEE